MELGIRENSVKFLFDSNRGKLARDESDVDAFALRACNGDDIGMVDARRMRHFL